MKHNYIFSSFLLNTRQGFQIIVFKTRVNYAKLIIPYIHAVILSKDFKVLFFNVLYVYEWRDECLSGLFLYSVHRFLWATSSGDIKELSQSFYHYFSFGWIATACISTRVRMRVRRHTRTHRESSGWLVFYNTYH